MRFNFKNYEEYEAYQQRERIKEYLGMFSILTIFLICFLLLLGAPKAHATTASWYGTSGDTTDPWKHTTTANGEHFNENALTAASWKYPFGSRVKVTNLRNHKSVVVRINDRGPGRYLYRKGRVIDLTREAFLRIAKLEDGIIPIKIILMGAS